MQEDSRQVFAVVLVRRTV